MPRAENKPRWRYGCVMWEQRKGDIFLILHERIDEIVKWAKFLKCCLSRKSPYISPFHVSHLINRYKSFSGWWSSLFLCVFMFRALNGVMTIVCCSRITVSLMLNSPLVLQRKKQLTTSIGFNEFPTNRDHIVNEYLQYPFFICYIYWCTFRIIRLIDFFSYFDRWSKTS